MSEKILKRKSSNCKSPQAFTKQAFDITTLKDSNTCENCHSLFVQYKELLDQLYQKDEQIEQLKDENIRLRCQMEKGENKSKPPEILHQLPRKRSNETPTLSDTNFGDSIAIPQTTKSDLEASDSLCFTFETINLVTANDVMEKLQQLNNAFLDLGNDNQFINIENMIMDGKSVFFTALDKKINKICETFEDLKLRPELEQELFIISLEPEETLELTDLCLSGIYVDGQYKLIKCNGNFGNIVLLGAQNAEICIACRNSVVADENCIIRWI